MIGINKAAINGIYLRWLCKGHKSGIPCGPHNPNVIAMLHGEIAY